ncbi:hypothetical protein BC830DRAFT_1050320, partial [Chytriomyces sp. MP71]
MTYYNPGGALGSCGSALEDSGFFVAMNPTDYNLNLCGASICISYNGQTVQGSLMDRCAGCAQGDIDVTPPVFSAFQPLSVG